MPERESARNESGRKYKTPKMPARRPSHITEVYRQTSRRGAVGQGEVDGGGVKQERVTDGEGTGGAWLVVADGGAKLVEGLALVGAQTLEMGARHDGQRPAWKGTVGEGNPGGPKERRAAHWKTATRWPAAPQSDDHKCHRRE